MDNIIVNRYTNHWYPDWPGYSNPTPLTDKPEIAFFSGEFYVIRIEQNLIKKSFNYMADDETEPFFSTIGFFLMTYLKDNKMLSLEQHHSIVEYLAPLYDLMTKHMFHREYLILLSYCFLYPNNLTLVFTLYKNETKRCIIKEFWNCFLYEIYTYGKDEEFLDWRGKNACIVIDNTFKVPRIFPFLAYDSKTYPLKNWGLSGSLTWQPLESLNSRCQSSNLKENYNLETGEIITLNPESILTKSLNLYLNEEKTNPAKLQVNAKGEIELMAVPEKLGNVIEDIILNLEFTAFILPDLKNNAWKIIGVDDTTGVYKKTQHATANYLCKPKNADIETEPNINLIQLYYNMYESRVFELDTENEYIQF